MAFDPRDFLSIAQKVADLSPEEAGLRTAVGRLYYAMFLLTDQAYVQRRRGRRKHEEVLKALKRQNGAAASHLQQLLQLRVQADYYPVPSAPRFSDWRRNHEAAERFARHIQRVLP